MVGGILNSSPLSIFLRIPLRIFPLLVLGSFSTIITPANEEIAPISFLTFSQSCFITFSFSSLVVIINLVTQKAKGTSPLIWQNLPTTALSIISSW